MNFTITDISEVITCPQCYFFPATFRWEIGIKRECRGLNCVNFEGKLKYIGGKIWSRVCLKWKQGDRRKNQTASQNGIG